MAPLYEHDLPPEVARVLADASYLRRRLLRLAEALAASSATVAEHLEQAVPAFGAPDAELVVLAERLTATTRTCRDFAQRLGGSEDFSAVNWGTVPRDEG